MFFLFSFLRFVFSFAPMTANELNVPKYEVCIRTIWDQTDNQSNVYTRINGKASYNTDEAWANLKLSITRFTKDTVLQIDKVVVGYSPIWDEEARIFIEIGRAPLNSMFCSGLQFNAPFNGLHLGYKNKNLTFHGALTVFGDYAEMWGAIAEAIYTFETMPLVLIHSYSNWHKYNITQTTLKYLIGYIRNQPIEIYGSFLTNLNFKDYGYGWELGTMIGKVIRTKDVRMQVAFKKLTHNSIPSYDFPKLQGLQIKGVYSLSDKLALSGTLWFNKLGNVEIGTHYVF